MAGRERSFVRDDRAKAVLEHAQELSQLALGTDVVYPEYFFWAMMLADQEHVRRLLTQTRGNAFDTAFRKMRAYAAEPLRHPHAAKSEEREAGMSEGLMALMKQAAQFAGKISDDDELVVTPELIVAAADTERVASDVVFRCWGVHPDHMRQYYREQRGIPIPLTDAEEARLIYDVPSGIAQFEQLLENPGQE